MLGAAHEKGRPNAVESHAGRRDAKEKDIRFRLHLVGPPGFEPGTNRL
jgi:hypothetical protein